MPNRTDAGGEEKIVLVSSSKADNKFPQRPEYLLKGMQSLGCEVEVVRGFNPVGGAIGALRKRKKAKHRIFSGYRSGAAGVLAGILGMNWVYDCVEPKAKLCRDNWSGAKRHLIVLVDFAERMMFRSAEVTFAATEDALSYARLYRKDVVPAFNGYDRQLFDPSRYDRAEIRRRQGVDFPLAIYIGKITPMYYKFLESAVKAMVEVNKVMPEAQFWIFGDGPDKKKLEGLARDQGGKVVFKGYIDHDLVPEVVAMADAGINAYDGSSLKMVEWFALGLPVIGPASMLDKNVVKAEWSPDGIAKILIDVLKKQSRVWVKVPTWEETAGTILDTLHSKGMR